MTLHPCANCGKIIDFREWSRKTRNHFCSNACRLAYLAKNARVNTCANCGKLYKKRYGNTHCCSVKCRDEWKLKQPHNCHVCGVLLKRDENWKPKGVCPEYVCMPCRKKLQAERVKKSRLNRQQSILQSVLRSPRSNGQLKSWNHVGKRPYTKSCEICGKSPKLSLHWHHWDDDHPEIGLWLCPKCHMRVNMYEINQIEPDFVRTYLRLKREVSNVGKYRVHSAGV
jgi:hypothetical protein